MSACDTPIVAEKSCNCCNDTELKALLEQQQSEIERLTQEIAKLSQQFAALPSIPTYTNQQEEALANNACVATCSDIDVLKQEIDDIHAATKYQLNDCSGLPIHSGDKVASCGDLNGVEERLKRYESQLNEAQRIANSALETAKNAETIADRAVLGTNIDTNTISGLISRLDELEKNLASTNTQLGTVAADVEASRNR